ncbi:hypothetical protein V9K67_22285 [Paraflavisolibacter sp. H34]|uniref:hypothetical protein n=1 Tax=Huijunlia imazamoxiresistens TaxID=3127457 RepID=UPI00301B1EC2
MINTFFLELRNPDWATFRLQQDGSFQRVASNPDFHKAFHDKALSLNEVIELQIPDQLVYVEGQEYLVRPTEKSKGLELPRLYYHVEVNRLALPDLPSKEMMVQTITAGNDDTINSLILTVDGKFELIDFKSIDKLFCDPNIALILRPWLNLGGVGISAAKNKILMGALYATMILFWRMHVQTGHTNMYVDSIGSMPEQEAIDSYYTFKKNMENYRVENAINKALRGH